MWLQQYFCKLLITIMQMLIKVITAQFLLTEEKVIHRNNQLYHVASKTVGLYTYWNKKSRLLWYIIVTVEKANVFWRINPPYHFPSLYLLAFYFLVNSRIFPSNINAGNGVGRMKKAEDETVSI